MLRALNLLGQCKYEYLRFDTFPSNVDEQENIFQPQTSSKIKSSIDFSSFSNSSSLLEEFSDSSSSSSNSKSIKSYDFKRNNIENFINISPYFRKINDNMKTRNQIQNERKTLNKDEEINLINHSPKIPTSIIVNDKLELKKEKKKRKVEKEVCNENQNKLPTLENLSKSKKRKRKEVEVLIEIPIKRKIKTNIKDNIEKTFKNDEDEEKVKKKVKRKKKKEVKINLIEDYDLLNSKKKEEKEIIGKSEKGIIENIGKIHLIQEKLRFDPWKLLIATCLLNKTSGRAALPILEILLKKYPTPKDLSEASITDLSNLLYPLGLFNQRSSTLIKFSSQYLNYNWPLYNPFYNNSNSNSNSINQPLLTRNIKRINNDKPIPENLDVKIFYGSGIYASDSFRIFSNLNLGKGAPENEIKWLKKGERSKKRMKNDWNGSIDELGEYMSDEDELQQLQQEEEEWRKVIPLG
uniref:HhH-GPD domain-containing protein n=1 Tax=Kwoniella pini CBS 10737 TaxID=1296096 RepID=A0A1B9I2P5_9TREE|nr:uncharacterized protein I206_04262 [Kwoniella pini CBS 10737]OCF49738.1 hypothetical protein I206_04262 [Kwoniella pini CBS 10737]